MLSLPAAVVRTAKLAGRVTGTAEVRAHVLSLCIRPLAWGGWCVNTSRRDWLLLTTLVWGSRSITTCAMRSDVALTTRLPEQLANHLTSKHLCTICSKAG